LDQVRSTTRIVAGVGFLNFHCLEVAAALKGIQVPVLMVFVTGDIPKALLQGAETVSC
jgi:hypothetical protein